MGACGVEREEGRWRGELLVGGNRCTVRACFQSVNGLVRLVVRAKEVFARSRERVGQTSSSAGASRGGLQLVHTFGRATPSCQQLKSVRRSPLPPHQSVPTRRRVNPARRSAHALARLCNFARPCHSPSAHPQRLKSVARREPHRARRAFEPASMGRLALLEELDDEVGF